MNIIFLNRPSPLMYRHYRFFLRFLPSLRSPACMTYLKPYSRKLRRNMTDAERILWRHLRGRQMLGAKFRRQEIFGRYIVDFYCPDARLIVEVDGSQHLAPESGDDERDRSLRVRGLHVLRFSNVDVLQCIDTVRAEIERYLMENGFGGK